MGLTRIFVIIMFVFFLGGCTLNNKAALEGTSRQEFKTLPSVNSRGFLGSSSCRGCHQQKYQNWFMGGHHNTIKDAGDSGAKYADFSIPGSPATSWSGFDIQDIKYVQGNGNRQYYIVKVKEKYFVLPALWIKSQRSWQPYYPESWQAKEREWRQACLPCHATGYDSNSKESAEMGIGCESCHGKGEDHVRNPVNVNVSNPANLGIKAQTELCGRCHTVSENPRLIRETTVGDVYRDFINSPHYKSRLLSCLSCHTNHSSAAGPGSLKKGLDELCADCHNPAGSAASKPLIFPINLNQYMPVKNTPYGKGVRSHSFN